MIEEALNIKLHIRLSAWGFMLINTQLSDAKKKKKKKTTTVEY